MTSGAEIALISGGWTAAVGIAGFGATVYTNRRTIKAAREARLHDQRTALYVDVLRAVQYRQLKRKVGTREVAPEERLGDNAAQLLEGFAEPEWHELEARQLALASEPVYALVQARSLADAASRDRFNAWWRDKTEDNRKAAVTARDAADDADDALVEQIRNELQGKGKPLASYDLQPLPSDPPPDAGGPAGVTA